MLLQEETGLRVEAQLTYDKTIALAQEFELLPPKQETFREAVSLVNNGLPFVKSMQTAPMEAVLTNDEIHPAARSDTGWFTDIYASVVMNKGYGPWTVVLSPDVMKRGEFVGFALDHMSTYVGHKMKETGQTLEQVMERYTLTPAEFREFYSYCLASLSDFPPNEYYSGEQYEEKLRFITFDIGLPIIRRADIVQMYYKRSWGVDDADFDRLQALAKSRGSDIVLYENRGTQSYDAEKELTAIVAHDFGVPRRFEETIQNNIG